MELAGGAYFFAFVGFSLMVVACWLLIPRASFVVTMAVFVHKMGFINLYDDKGPEVIIGFILLIVMVAIGFVMDIVTIKKFIREN